MDINTSTPLIELATGAYPKYLFDARQANPSVSFSNQPTEEFLATLGYAGVQLTAKPVPTDTQVVQEDAPKEVDGAYQQVWIVRDMDAEEQAATLASARATAANAVDAARDATLNDLPGMEWLFPDASIGHVQLDDRSQVRLLILQGSAMLLRQQGVTDPVIVFRDYENQNHDLTPEQCLELCTAAAQYGTDLFRAGWALKAEINAAAKPSEIPVVPQYLTVPAP